MNHSKCNSDAFPWLKVFSNACFWIQHAQISLNDVIEINTGAPQGYVLSAVLFIIHTSDCRSLSKHVIVKYADVIVIIGLVSNEEYVTTYIHEINHFVDWCDNNF